MRSTPPISLLSILWLCLAVLLGAGCATDARVKAELGFGALIGKWLPRLVVEVEIKQDDEEVPDLFQYLRTFKWTGESE